MSPDENHSTQASPNEADEVSVESEVLSPNDGASLRTDDSASQRIAQAKTVIRNQNVQNSPERPGRTPADIAKVLVGKTLNQYRLDELIGGGGMGAVFRAHDERLDRTVAIKVIPFVGNDPEMQRRFRNEAQNAAKLDHPRIARVYDANSHDDWHYIVFEYIRGTNLRDLVNHVGVLNLDDAVYYCCQLAEALQHSADRGIVHRDIKPSNILIGDNDTIKLVDMGLARSENLDLSEDMTASGVTLGTFDYISPEQALDPRDADLRSDIYSLGCTLYFMLTGQPPYTGGTMLQKLLSHGNAPLPDARQIRSDIPADLIAVMQRMMAKEPKLRYQTARDLVADLMEVAYRHQLTRSLSLGISAAAPPNEAMIWFQKHSPWIVAVTLCLMVALWFEFSGAASRESFVIDSFAKSSNGAADVNVSANDRLPIDDSNAGPQIDPLNGVNSGQTNQSPLDSGPSGSDPSISPAIGDASIDNGNRLTPNSASPEPGEGGSPATSGENTDDVDPSNSDPTSDNADISSSPTLIRVVSSDEQLPEVQADSLFPQDIDGAAITKSLEDALDWAGDLQIDRVEISASDLTCGPIEVEHDNLEIVSTLPGGTTVRLNRGDQYDMNESRMFVIGSSRVSMQGLHLEWEIEADQTDGGSMIVMNDNRLVKIRDCSLSLINRSRHENVYVFSVLTGPDTDQTAQFPLLEPDTTAISTVPNQGDSAQTSLPLVGLQLDNVIIRADAGMMKMDYAAALQFVWRNGLLSISKRMIETGGARQIPSRTEEIQLSLRAVTMDANDGLFRMRLDATGPYPIPVNRDSVGCVYVVGTGQPHFEFTGLQTFDDTRPLVQLHGESIAYNADRELSDPFLVMTNDESETRTTTISNIVNEYPDWFKETSPRWRVFWSEKEESDSAPSQRLPIDYRQDGSFVDGFDESKLPLIPKDQVDPTLLNQESLIDDQSF